MALHNVRSGVIMIIIRINNKWCTCTDLERLLVAGVTRCLRRDVTDPARVTDRIDFHWVRLHFASQHGNVHQFGGLLH